MPKQLTPDPDTDLQVLVPIDGEKRDATPSYQHVQALFNKIARLERTLSGLEQRFGQVDAQLLNRRTLSLAFDEITLGGDGTLALGVWPFITSFGDARLSEVYFNVGGFTGSPVTLQVDTTIDDGQAQINEFNRFSGISSDSGGINLGKGSATDSQLEVSLTAVGDVNAVWSSVSIFLVFDLDL